MKLRVAVFTAICLVVSSLVSAQTNQQIEVVELSDIQFPAQELIGIYTNAPRLHSDIHVSLLSIAPTSSRGFPIMPAIWETGLESPLAGIVVFVDESQSINVSDDFRRFLYGMPHNEFQLLTMDSTPYLIVRVVDEASVADFFRDLSADERDFVSRFVQSTKQDQAAPSPTAGATIGSPEDRRESGSRDVNPDDLRVFYWMRTMLIEFSPDFSRPPYSRTDDPRWQTDAITIPYRRFDVPVIPINTRGETVVDLGQAPMFGGLSSIPVDIVLFESLGRTVSNEEAIRIVGTEYTLGDVSLVFISSDILSAPVFVPDPLDRNGPSLDEKLFAIAGLSRREHESLAAIVDGVATRQNENFLLLPLTPTTLGGRDDMIVPTFVRFDLSPGLEPRGGGLVLHVERLGDTIATIETTTVRRTSRRALTLHDLPPGFIVVDGLDQTPGFELVRRWGESFPYRGSGAIFNYLPSPEKESVPVILFIEPDYSYREEEAVQFFFEATQRELDERLDREPFFYSVTEYREDYPRALLIGARDPETFYWHLENDLDFLSFVEEFYAQEYSPFTPSQR